MVLWSIKNQGGLIRQMKVMMQGASLKERHEASRRAAGIGDPQF